MDSENIKRDSFLIYRTFRDAGQLLPKEKRLAFYESIMAFGLDGIPFPETKDPVLKMAYLNIKPLIEANIRNYLNGCKGGAPQGNMNAKGYGRPKKTTEKQPKNNRKTTEKQGNVNDNVNVNVNDNDNDNYHSENDEPLRPTTLKELEARGVTKETEMSKKRGFYS